MTQENQHPNPEQENSPAQTPSEAVSEPAAIKTPEEEIAELNQKITSYVLRPKVKIFVAALLRILLRRISLRLRALQNI